MCGNMKRHLARHDDVFVRVNRGERRSGTEKADRSLIGKGEHAQILRGVGDIGIGPPS